MAAFVWDGVFIGVTATRGMLTAVATACGLFFLLYFTLPTSLGNHTLWISFVAFLTTRSAVQTIWWACIWLNRQR
jgi:MATE family multidrug resistance protein